VEPGEVLAVAVEVLAEAVPPEASLAETVEAR